MLEHEADEGKPKAKPKGRRRSPRHPLPDHLERETVVLESEGLKPCEHCRQAPGRTGEETSEELDYVPAKVVVRRTVRPKYACRCGCGGVAIAPLLPRRLPQGKLGLGLAVNLLLGRFDDHVAYYTLERIFLERHAVVIPRQQMVQWVAHIAFLLQPICRLMFKRMKEGAYFQVDETPVKVMDPEVKGKCARLRNDNYFSPVGNNNCRSTPARQLEAHADLRRHLIHSAPAHNPAPLSALPTPFIRGMRLA